MKTKGRCREPGGLHPRAVGESRAPSADAPSSPGPITPRRRVHVGPPTDDHIRFPGIAESHPAFGARSLADMLPAVIGKAESLGMQIVAQHLAMALKMAERLAADGIERQG